MKTVRGVVIVNNPLVPLFGEPCFKQGNEVRYEDEELSARFDFDVDDDGRLILLDHKTCEIRVYNAQGSLLLKFGKHGQGPGEMQMPVRLSAGPKGDILVLDISPLRLVWYSLKGEYLRAERLPIDALIISIKPLKDGDYVASISFNGWSGELRRYRQALTSSVTLLKREHEPSPKGEVHLTADDISFAVDGESRVICGTAERYELLVSDASGKVVRMITKAQIAEPYPEYAKRQDLELLSSNPWFRNYKIIFPSAKPAFREFTTDEEGDLLVRVYGPKDSNVIEIFDKEGFYLGDAQLDCHLGKIIVRKNRIYGFRYDEDGFPLIRSYEMVWNPRFLAAKKAPRPVPAAAK